MFPSPRSMAWHPKTRLRPGHRSLLWCTRPWLLGLGPLTALPGPSSLCVSTPSAHCHPVPKASSRVRAQEGYGLPAALSPTQDPCVARPLMSPFTRQRLARTGEPPGPQGHHRLSGAMEVNVPLMELLRPCLGWLAGRGEVAPRTHSRSACLSFLSLPTGLETDPSPLQALEEEPEAGTCTGLTLGHRARTEADLPSKFSV